METPNEPRRRGSGRNPVLQGPAALELRIRLTEPWIKRTLEAEAFKKGLTLSEYVQRFLLSFSGDERLAKVEFSLNEDAVV